MEEMCCNRTRASLEARFLAKVNKIPGGCWLWTGSCVPGGYGQMAAGPPLAGGKLSRPMRATRIAWELYRGQIPSGLNVLHDCPAGDNPSCVNPEHLWLGTIAQNNEDMRNKGRDRRGGWAADGYRAPGWPVERRAVRAKRSGPPRKGCAGIEHYAARLTEHDVAELRSMAVLGTRNRDLAAKFHISRSSVSHIISRKTWRHVQ